MWPLTWVAERWQADVTRQQSILGPEIAAIRRDHRGRGVGTALLNAAVDYAFAHGAPIVEAYPLIPVEGQPVSEYSAFTGTLQRHFESELRPVSPEPATESLSICSANP